VNRRYREKDKAIMILYGEQEREYAIRNPTKFQEVWKAYIELHDQMQHSTNNAKEKPGHTRSIWCSENSALPKS